MNQHGEFIRGLASLKPSHRGCVATIGAFDGVHRGHIAILEQVIEKSRELQLPSLVVVFEPLPSEYFSRDSSLRGGASRGNPPSRVMRLRAKVCALFEAGIDRVLCLKFDESLRSLTAEAYIDRVLVNGLGVKHLVIGDDFHFGCDRSGDFAMLCKAGKALGFTVCDTKTVEDSSGRISSTRIRALLKSADLAGAAQLLGRPFSIMGRVIYGNQLGRKLGFPTANIHLGTKAPPLSGVFAVRVRVGVSPTSSLSLPGVANIGVRPTVNGARKPLLEVHVLANVQTASEPREAEKNHAINWYGEYLNVEFVEKIRSEQRFDSIDDLRLQIARDCAAAKTVLGLTEPESNM